MPTRNKTVLAGVAIIAVVAFAAHIAGLWGKVRVGNKGVFEGPAILSIYRGGHLLVERALTDDERSALHEWGINSADVRARRTIDTWAPSVQVSSPQGDWVLIIGTEWTVLSTANVPNWLLGNSELVWKSRPVDLAQMESLANGS